MYLTRFQKSTKASQVIPRNPTLDLNNARRLQKQRNQTLSKQKNKIIINNQIVSLENQWKQIRHDKDIDQPKINTIPRTKIFLATLNGSFKSQKPKHKTITISTVNNSLSSSVITKLQNFSPTKSSPSKWKKHAKTPSSLQTSAIKQVKEIQGCNSPIKKYLHRFRQMTKQAEIRHTNATMQIQQILFKNIR